LTFQLVDGKLKIVMKISADKKLSINKSLIWDYDFKGRTDTPEFKKWYIARVLSCGRMEDVRQIGLTVIKDYFPQLNLSLRIKKFWEWYFRHAYSH